MSQAWRYDSDGRYVKTWIDSLKDFSGKDIEIILRPWDFLEDWGTPLVSPETQLTWQDREKMARTGEITAGD